MASDSTFDNDKYLDDIERSAMWLRRKVRNLKGAVHEFENRMLDADALIELDKIEGAYLGLHKAWHDALDALNTAQKYVINNDRMSAAFRRGLSQ